MTHDVEQAIRDIRAAYPDTEVDVVEDGAGGAKVVVRAIPLSEIYTQRETWFGFHIADAYPYADVYPHFVRPDLQRVDGRPLGNGTSSAPFLDKNAIQLSRRSSRLNPATDTALLKLQKVLRWLNDGP